MSKADIVRHRLVQAIVLAYDDQAPLEPEKRTRRSARDR
jgi:phosphate starvation-inducible protein PhoH